MPQFAVVVPGVELTTEHLGTEVHVVVYDVQFLILCGERRKIPLYLQNGMPDYRTGDDAQGEEGLRELGRLI